MITTVGIVTFPTFFTPKPNLSGDLVFGCTLLIDKTDKKGIAELKGEVAKAIAKGKEKHWNGKVPKFTYQPLRDGDAELKDGSKEGPEYKGRIFFGCSCAPDQAPGVVGPDGKPLMSQKAIYSGCFVRLDVRAFAYKKGGNNGVGWWLNNVMLVDDGPRLDGKMDAVDAFAQYATENYTSDGDGESGEGGEGGEGAPEDDDDIAF